MTGPVDSGVGHQPHYHLQLAYRQNPSPAVPEHVGCTSRLMSTRPHSYGVDCQLVLHVHIACHQATHGALHFEMSRVTLTYSNKDCGSGVTWFVSRPLCLLSGQCGSMVAQMCHVLVWTCPGTNRMSVRDLWRLTQLTCFFRLQHLTGALNAPMIGSLPRLDLLRT